MSDIANFTVGSKHKVLVMTTGLDEAHEFLKLAGCKPLVSHQTMYQSFGYFTSPQGDLWYWETCDLRFLSRVDSPVLFRQVESLEDKCGGPNHYPEDKRELVQLLRRETKHGNGRSSEPLLSERQGSH